MKIYSVFELNVVKVDRGNDTYQYFICEKDIIPNNYIEIFSKEKIKNIDECAVEPLSNYYSLFEQYNYKKRKPLRIDMKELFKKYNEINYVKLNLELDEETIEKELTNRGIFQKSKVYKKRNNIKE